MPTPFMPKPHAEMQPEQVDAVYAELTPLHWGPKGDRLLLLGGFAFAVVFPVLTGPDLASRLALVVGALMCGGLMAWVAQRQAAEVRVWEDLKPIRRDALAFGAATMILATLMRWLEAGHSLATLERSGLDMLGLCWLLARGGALMALLLTLKSLGVLLLVQTPRLPFRHLKHPFPRVQAPHKVFVHAFQPVAKDLRSIWRELKGEESPFPRQRF